MADKTIEREVRLMQCDLDQPRLDPAWCEIVYHFHKAWPELCEVVWSDVRLWHFCDIGYVRYSAAVEG